MNIRTLPSAPLATLMAAFLFLVGCYLPDDFRVDMQIAADGRYAFVYEGDLTQLQFDLILCHKSKEE